MQTFNTVVEAGSFVAAADALKLSKAAVSRQREYLADASAVAYTRNPRGIGLALAKIAGHGSSLRNAIAVGGRAGPSHRSSTDSSTPGTAAMTPMMRNLSS